MAQSKIEWLGDQVSGKPGYTINPVKGLCPVDCKDNQGKSYCYARRMYTRFKWNPEIRYDPVVFDSMPSPGSKVFIGSTMELFGEWVEVGWMRNIIGNIKEFPELTFIFLTKRPENLIQYSPFPGNCYIGVSVTNQEMHNRAIACLTGIQASVKFISYEPLLSEIKPSGAYDLTDIQWVIIGAQTPVSAKSAPEIEWVREIVEAADKARIPVFLKNNLISILPPNTLQSPFHFGVHGIRQEYPVVK